MIEICFCLKCGERNMRWERFNLCKNEIMRGGVKSPYAWWSEEPLRMVTCFSDGLGRARNGSLSSPASEIEVARLENSI
ncbi:predicted protein [Chaetoceros tenuissimus]|uniref:Uncharacterized protein n=1 Tax=Chaetoceros tenuissimus TaxID=426638 RepID=A0AAD3D3F2_9STRA|nr:predicted protein [Chaetoceros tenuissimus]